MRIVTGLAGAILAAACVVTDAAPTALRFSAPEGGVANEFYRPGPVAAHLVLTSAATPRLVIAFPAGNSGAAVWFDPPGGGLTCRRNSGVYRFWDSQAASQHKPRIAPPMRIGITTQFARQPTVENVTTDHSVLNCPSKVTPQRAGGFQGGA